MDENEDDLSESNEDPNVESNEKPMHLCLGAFSDRQIPTIRGPFSAASTKRKIKKMRDLAEELSIHAKVQTILCYVSPNKKFPTRFLESFGEHADGFLYSTKLGEKVYSTLDTATKTWIGPYSGKKPEKKHVTKKTMDSVIDENDKNTTEIARNEVAIAVKKAATVKRLKLLEEQRKKKNEKLACVKPKKPVNKKSNPIQGPVTFSPPPNLIAKSSACLPSAPNNGRSSQSYTPQKICSSNLSVSLVKDRINEDPIHGQDSICDTPITKITTSEEISLASIETDDENLANDNPLSLLEKPLSIFEFSQDEAMALDCLSQPKIVSPVRSTNSLVPSLKANKHSNINCEIFTKFSFPAKSLLNHDKSKSKSQPPVPLIVEKTKDSPSETRRTKQKSTCQSENSDGINGGLPLEKSRSKNKAFSAVAAAKKRKYPENGENTNQFLTTGCAILSHCTSERETETVQSAPVKKKKLPKDASGKKKSKHTSYSILSHCTPEKGMKTSVNAPLKKKQLSPKDSPGKKKSEDTSSEKLSHCTPEKGMQTSVNAPLKKNQLPRDDSCSPSSSVSTSCESVVQKKWIFVSDDSPDKVKQIKPKKRLFLCGK